MNHLKHWVLFYESTVQKLSTAQKIRTQLYLTIKFITADLALRKCKSVHTSARKAS